MHKNKAAEAGATSSTSPPGGSGDNATSNAEHSAGDAGTSSSTSSFTILQAAPELTREQDLPLRDPFADEEEDEDASGSGSGSDGEEGGAAERGSSGWHRGSWWRGVVHSARGRSGRKETTSRAAERFGDGRDDSDESEEEEAEGLDDEEFGDFAMPEGGAEGSSAGGGGEAGAGSGGAGGPPGEGLVKPLPLHPKHAPSPFGSLWPFSGQGFGIGAAAGGKEKEEAAAGKGKGREGEPEITEEPLELEANEGVATPLDEEGKKIEAAVEAKRRTSIEDPDDDEDEEREVVVGRGRR